MLSFPADFPHFPSQKKMGFQGRLDGQIYRLQVAARRAFQVGQAFHRPETASMDWFKGKIYRNICHIFIYFKGKSMVSG